MSFLISKVTVADVLRAAIAQLKKPGGYTDGAYFAPKNRNEYPYSLDIPGENVGAVCAIGGVEQAIWQLTGEVLTDERRLASYRGKAASRRRVSQLYAQTMRLLNQVALESPAAKRQPDGFFGANGEPVGCSIEQLTFYSGNKAPVVRAFERALELAEQR